MRHRNRFISDILESIASVQDTNAMVEALRRASRPVRELLRFAYCDTESALPNGPLNFRPYMDPKSYDEPGATGDEDLLSYEAIRGNLARFFLVGGHPTLTQRKRIELYLQIAERLPPRELEILETIRSHRALPGKLARITRNAVRQAFPGLLDVPVVPQKVEEYACAPGLLHVPPGENAPTRSWIPHRSCERGKRWSNAR